MKRLLSAAFLLLIPLGVSAEGITNDNFEFGTGVKFISERVSHGVRICGKALHPSVFLGYKVSEDLKVTLAVDAIAALGEKYGRLSPCLSATYDATDMLTIDTGYTHYFYLSSNGQKQSNEIYGGIIVNIPLSPALYAFYDFDNEDFSVETKISHLFDLSEHIISGIGVEVGAKIGYETARKAGGERIADDERKNFLYYGVGADLVYSINDNARAKIGVTYEGNSAEKNSWVNGKNRDFIFWKASIDCSF